MNEKYNSIKSILKNVEKYRKEYHECIGVNLEKLDNILGQFPKEDPIRQDIISYVHSLEGVRISLVTAADVHENKLRVSLVDKLNKVYENAS